MTLPSESPYDVFLSHSAKDKAVVSRTLSACLKGESDGGRTVKQIVFESARFDVMSVRRWRDRALSQGLP